MGAGERIKAIRKEKNLSQNQLAKLAGISQSGLSSIENGSVKPKEDALYILAKALQCSASDLIDSPPEISSEMRNDMEETLYRRPGMRVLFDAVKGAPDEVLQQTIDIIEVLKNGKKR